MIVFEAVTKVYEPNVVALEDLSLAIEKGEFVFLVGPSGSGKSTIVRLLLKELEPTDGRIIIGGRELGRLGRGSVPMLRRNIGCVFQDFKLLPNRTAFENIAYALKVQGQSTADDQVEGARGAEPRRPLSQGELVPRRALRRRAAARLDRDERSSTIRLCSSATSRPATSTRTHRSASCSFSTASTEPERPSSWPPTTARWSTRCAAA